MSDRSPPADVQLEQALLGLLMVWSEAYEGVSGILRAEDFSLPVHARLFTAISALIDQGRSPDPIALRARFEHDEALSQVGGADYLVKLVDTSGLRSNALHYAEQIADLARRRRLIEACEAALVQAYVVDIEVPVSAILSGHDERLAELNDRRTATSARPIGEAVQESIDATEAAYKAGGKLSGIETGLIDLDRRIGGLLPGNLELIAGRPSMGKSALAANIVVHAARREIPCLMFSLEETRLQQAQRMITLLSGVSGERQRRGDLDMIQWPAVVSAAGRLSSLPIYLDDTPGLTIGDIRRRSRDMRRRLNIALVVVDHIQLIRVGEGRFDGRTQEMGEISRSLKELAKELGIPVLALCQLSRAVEARDNKRPMLSDLRESGSIEQDADRVIFVFREEYYLERTEPMRRSEEAQDKFNERYGRWKENCEAARGKAELIVGKNRMGPVGTVRVHWNGELTEFSNSADPERVPERDC